LAERLRHLEAHGVIERDGLGTYKLTKRGLGLAGPVYALARWAGLLMAEPIGDDQFRSSWLVPAVAGIFDAVDPKRPDTTIEVHTGETPMTTVSTGGRVHVQPGAADNPDLVITGPPEGVIGLLAGANDKGATKDGIVVEGDIRHIARLRGSTRTRTALEFTSHQLSVQLDVSVCRGLSGQPFSHLPSLAGSGLE
jgi:hypothetical protein